MLFPTSTLHPNIFFTQQSRHKKTHMNFHNSYGFFCSLWNKFYLTNSPSLYVLVSVTFPSSSHQVQSPVLLPPFQVTSSFFCPFSYHLISIPSFFPSLMVSFLHFLSVVVILSLKCSFHFKILYREIEIITLMVVSK